MSPILTGSTVDVLVVGAGPSGLMCANALSRAGVNVRIVDKKPTKVLVGQADGIQPRTIEVFQSYDLADMLLREGNHMHMAAFYVPGSNGGIEFAGRAPDVGAPTARYPFEVTIHQGFIESLFMDSMKTHGVEVERPVYPTSLKLSENEAELKDPNAYPITVTLEGGKEPETVRAKFVVGSDGAHSWVRKSLGIEMEGSQTEYVWGVLDFIPETDFPDVRNKSNIRSENGSCMIIPREGNKIRVYVQLAAGNELVDSSGRLDRTKIGPKDIFKVAQRAIQPYKLEMPNDFEWWTLYNIGQRVASQFSVKDRVFISGDACHTHSPKAGQGMNASMNDTHNLAWKLAYVLRGKAKLDLLSTYEFERRHYAQQLIDFDKKYSKLFSDKAQTTSNIEGVSHEEFLSAFKAHLGFTSGIAVHYFPSLITNNIHQHLAANLIVGERVPPQTVVRAADFRPYEIQDLLPSDIRFKILVFSGDSRQDARRNQLETLAQEMQKPGGLLSRIESWESILEILLISTARKADVKYTDLPPLFRRHWSKIFIDDLDVTEKIGGQAYTAYGIDRDGGAIVVVRPDGYVGTIAPLNEISYIDDYFSHILV